MSLRTSLAWTYLAQVASFLISFASTVVIARLVSPRDFGILAMASAISTIIAVFLGFHLAKYIMREKEVSSEVLQSVFTVNVIMTLLYVVAILAGSFAAFRISHSADVGRFLLVFAIFPLLAMMEFVPAALCTRDARFGVISILSVLRAIVMAVTTIVLASRGFAYMSFAWAQVLAWLATSIGYNWLAWRPDAYRLRFKEIRPIITFGTQMMSVSGVAHLSTRVGEMVLGSLLGLASLGLYTRASNLTNQLYSNIYGAGSNVMFSRLSEELRTTGRIHDTYLRFMNLMLGLLWPMMFGVAVLAQPTIHILYGAKWQAAASPLALLMIAFAITVGIGMSAEIFILRHQTKQQVKIEMVRSLVGLALFSGAALISLPGAAAAKVAEAVLAALLYRKPMARLVGGPEGDLRRMYMESSLLTGAAVLPSLVLMWHYDWSPSTPVPLIVAAVSLGILFWAALIVSRRHPILVEASRMLRLRL